MNLNSKILDNKNRGKNNIKIVLNMIVKNESKIIIRLLESVYEFIDSYCICDTGSTDNTIELINNFFDDKKIEGYVMKHQFKNFGYNRNWSLNKCKLLFNDFDFILLPDADMVVKYSKDIVKFR